MAPEECSPRSLYVTPVADSRGVVPFNLSLGSTKDNFYARVKCTYSVDSAVTADFTSRAGRKGEKTSDDAAGSFFLYDRLVGVLGGV